MAQVLQLRRGTTAQNDAFTGAIAEVSVDTDRDSLRVHDGTTVGGTEIAPLRVAVPLLPAASSVSGSDEVPVIQGGLAKRATKTQILDGIVNSNISASAAIAHAKLAPVTAGQVILGNSSNVATATAVSGDVTISDSGVTTIANNAITSAKILNGTIVDGDISGSANISGSKMDDLSITSNKLADDAVTTAKIDDDAVTTAKINDAAVTFAKQQSPQYTGFRNAIINGDFRVAQRGTTFASGANNDDSYNLDCWYVLSDGNDAVDISQESSEVPTNGLRAIALDVETANKKFGIAQIIEQQNCLGLIGGAVTLSFRAKVSATTKLDNVKAAIVAWSGTADTVTSDIISAWGAEGTNPTLIANATYENTPANLNVTTSYATYTVTANVDTASTKNIIVFIWSDVTDTTAGDFLYITDVQLEARSVATPFERRPIGTELALCQRYFVRYSAVAGTRFGPSYNVSTTQADTLIRFPVSMRIAPTALAAAGSANFVIYYLATQATAITGPSWSSSTNLTANISTTSSGLTAGQASQLGALNSSAFLSFSAEL